MTEAVSVAVTTNTAAKHIKRANGAPPMAVQKFEGLSLEPTKPTKPIKPTKDDVVELGAKNTNNNNDDDDDGDDNDDDADADNCDTEATTKEEEWITKRKTELITTRQIETRVKRQVVLEDGKVIEDSGPIVSTNTTEDTDKQETETTERRDLGCPETISVATKPNELEGNGNGEIIDGVTTKDVNHRPGRGGPPLDEFGGKMVHKLVARPADGLVREINEKRVISHEEIKDRLETEDVRHLGDFSDQTYLDAVNSGADNLEAILYSAESQQQLLPLGPRIVHHSNKAHKIIDSEDIVQRCLAQADGTLVTEKKKTTEHEEIYDKPLPDKDDKSTGSREKINTTESSQRFYKQRDEQNVDTVDANGKVIATEMRYAAETEQMERDGLTERPGDWDSLSDRIRKSRRVNKTLLQQQKEAALLADRKDALTKRPLDFDREEETRKGETMKWLVSHFGSESTASNDSREEDPEIEPTKKTFFNVTIKSNQTSPPEDAPVPVTGNSGVVGLGLSDIRPAVNGNGNGIGNGVVGASKLITADGPNLGLSKTKYFQGITNWADRKDVGPKHFASKAFRDELQGTLERNRANRHVAAAASREDLRYVGRPSKGYDDSYVSREDILQQKRQQNVSESRKDLRFRRESRDEIDDLKANRFSQKEDLGYLSGSRTDVRYRLESNEEADRNNAKNRKNSGNGFLKREDSGYVKDSSEDVRSSVLRDGEICDDKHLVLAATEKQVKLLHIQRDDSAYVSSSTYFTETRPPPPKTVHALLHTPDSGIRSPSPIEPNHKSFNTLPAIVSSPSEANHRPTVPQRRRAIEKKLRQQTSYSPPSPVPFHHNGRDEPPPDYSPPPRSRSVSPQPIIIPTHPGLSSGGLPVSRKQNQRTRFASESSSVSQQQQQLHHHHKSRPTTSTQTTQTSPPSVASEAISTSAHHTRHNAQKPATTKVGQAIGNSLRKLVGKIRSASAERKFRMKSKSKSRERSPSPPMVGRSSGCGGGGGGRDGVVGSGGGPGSTYQQYNVIDSHIGGESGGSGGGGHSAHATLPQQRTSSAAPFNRETPSIVSSLSTTVGRDRPHPSRNDFVVASGTERSMDELRRGSSDLDYMASPKRYYLGEDPYSGGLFGKENKYDPKVIARKNREAREVAVDTHEIINSNVQQQHHHNQQQQQQQLQLHLHHQPPSQHLHQHRSRRGASHDDNRGPTFIQQRHLTSNTLGRYQKSKDRIMSSTPNLESHDYRSTQTLPRKLPDHHNSSSSSAHQPGRQHQQHYQHPPQHHSSTINVSIVNPISKPPQLHQHLPTQNTGPAKPARTYAKTLNRSKSCSIHGMNGTNDPSPIYIEKLTRNNYTTAALPSQQQLSGGGCSSNNSNSISYMNAGNSGIYKSNPHLYPGNHDTKENYPLQSGLKSPSIVNLISRSQKDLTKIDSIDADQTRFSGDRRYTASQHHNHHGYTNGNGNGNGNNQSHKVQDKKHIFLKGLQEQAPDLYKTLHGNSGDSVHKYPHHELSSSLESRSPIEINKDTASIIRQSSSSTEDYSETYKYVTTSDDPNRPMLTNTVQSFRKKTANPPPVKNGRGMETVRTSEKRSVSKQQVPPSSRFRPNNGASTESISNLKYLDELKRRGSGSTIIEVRNTNSMMRK